VFFRAESVSSAVEILWRMLFAWGPAPLVTGPVLITIAASLAVQFVPRTFTKNLMGDISRLSPIVQAVRQPGSEHVRAVGGHHTRPWASETAVVLAVRRTAAAARVRSAPRELKAYAR
jgi:hypothetical protein